MDGVSAWWCEAKPQWLRFVQTNEMPLTSVVASKLGRRSWSPEHRGDRLPRSKGHLVLEFIQSSSLSLWSEWSRVRLTGRVESRPQRHQKLEPSQKLLLFDPSLPGFPVVVASTSGRDMSAQSWAPGLLDTEDSSVPCPLYRQWS